MSSLIEGYNYDIFISYRQKDNKGDRWVSEFVEALKTELESTFKEEISVYFDINPHDGLLETHDVDASLKEKLKCLVFIPIISRTYCDPKSFAWEHEFKAFVDLASQDKFGLKVKLPNGNVASRVLPVRIHDLDQEDIKLCESVLGGVLRGVEFIYKSAGVNRPLRANEDHQQDNINKTYYRDQINKVANSIKEIIQGLSIEPVKAVREKDQHKASFIEVGKDESRVSQEKPVKALNRKLLYSTAIVALLIIAGIIAYPKIFKRNTLERLRSSGEKISVAVMPFQNITKDSIWDDWQDGIKDELINFLMNYNEELDVRRTETIDGILQSKGLTNYASITPSVASSISQKLDANVVINGSIKQAGTRIRLNAELIDSKTGDPLKSFKQEGPAIVDSIFYFIDALTVQIRDFLIVSKLEKEMPRDFQGLITTKSPDAYKLYISGMNAFTAGNFSAAAKYLSNILNIDSNFIYANVQLTYAIGNQGLYDSAKKCCLKLYKKVDQMPEVMQTMVRFSHARWFETPFEEIRYGKQILGYDDQSPGAYCTLGDLYNIVHQYDDAINAFRTGFDIYKKWESKPVWFAFYTWFGIAYHKTGQYEEEEKLYINAERDFPDNQGIIYRQAILALTLGKTDAADKYIERYKFLQKESSATDASIATNLAVIYSEAGVLDKAEEYYRKALLYPPFDGQTGRKQNLAYFLIDKEQNIDEGMQMVEEALKMRTNIFLLDCKGWGLYKKGKYKEALVLLDSAWNLRTPNRNSMMSTYFHREEVKKKVESLK
jgi:tetratricopeptide (TPR) repeat protein